jgi:hypothetical protein
MDMTLLRHSDFRVAGRRPARIDYHVFVATLQALQLATATAQAGSRWGGADAECQAGNGEPLAEILLGSGDWQEAVLAQGGSFNPVFAKGTAHP